MATNRQNEEMHTICINRVASTILTTLNVAPSDKMADPIPEVLEKSKECDRVFMYNPDAVAAWIYQKYRDDFRDMEKDADLVLPMLSVYPSVTPVCFGSMYSGLMPKDHGILKYEKPVLQVPTVFDQIPKAGKKAAIVSTAGDSISMIFLNRDVDYFIYPTKEECNQKAKELIREDKHDLIVLYNGDYDHYMHRHTPEGKRALRALRENIATHGELKEEIRRCWKGHKTMMTFAPDHGCHRVYGFFGNHGTNEPCDMNIMHFYHFL